MRLPQVYHTPPANAVWSCYVRIRSTSCPEIGAFLFSALDVGGFSAAGNCKTVACLALSQKRQQNDFAVRKFERVVIGPLATLD